MLYVPLTAGVLVAGRFSLQVVLLTLSITFLFIARESLVQWWRSRQRGLARNGLLRMLTIYVALAAVFGAPLVVVYDLYWLIPAGALAVILMAANAGQSVGAEGRKAVWEVVAIAGLTLTAPAAHYTALGVPQRTALWLWALSALYFTSSVFYVKLRVLHSNPRKEDSRRKGWRRCALYHAVLLASLVVFSVTRSLNLFAIIAFAPVLARAFWLLIKPASDLNLRRIGIVEIIYSVVFLIFITLTFRVA